MEIQHDGAGELSSAAGPLWPEAKKLLSDRLMPRTLSPQLYSAWIEPLHVRMAAPDAVEIVSPNEFFHRYVLGHYRKEIEEALREGAMSLGITELKVTFTFSVRPPQELPHEMPHPEFSIRPFTAPMPARGGSGDLFARHALALNRSFTFANFVVGNPNRMAHTTARAFSDDPEMSTGILFLQSENGLGKSHLSQALVHHVREHSPESSVLYVTAEHFTNLMTMSLNRRLMDDFKRRFREDCDILMVEDVTFLSGKERIQDELRMTLDSLLNRGKKIVLTSTRPPRQIPGLNRALRSRMNSSLIAHIGPPDFDTRLKILDRKATSEGLRIDRKVLEFIADRVTSDVRLLEASIASVKATVRASGRPADLDMATDCVGSLPTSDGHSPINLDSILKFVCRTFNVTEEDLASQSRLKRHSEARRIGIYLSRRLTGKTLVEIGKLYGRRHSSALYTINKMDEEYRDDPRITRQVDYYIGELTRPRY
ncbi:MAG: chromosomal replication initiator protein DnaA [Deltaproteobacteria bacterium]|jgi:chromosomal replication initiator protein|nr:chromosomal replication initiator protein DnaA [Deltaproteobacteria bacterium]